MGKDGGENLKGSNPKALDTSGFERLKLRDFRAPKPTQKRLGKARPPPQRFSIREERAGRTKLDKATPKTTSFVCQARNTNWRTDN